MWIINFINNLFFRKINFYQCSKCGNKVLKKNVIKIKTSGHYNGSLEVRDSYMCHDCLKEFLKD